MATLTCEHGCTHAHASCETENCSRCNIGGRTCSVAAFIAANRADGREGALPARTDEPQVAVTLTVAPVIAELLAVLDDGDVNDSIEAQVSRVLCRLADHAQQGVYRPGAWERNWLAQVFGDEFLARLCPGDPYHRYPDCTLEVGCACRGCAMFERPA